MRALVVADIHANLEAFETVLRDAEAEGHVEAVWCLGDTVGYGAEPDACIDLLRGYPHQAIAGNHDLAAIGAIDTDDFNAHAAAAAHWTSENISPESRQWISGLPNVAVAADEFTLTHGSLYDPIWEYLVGPDAAADHLTRQTTPYGFVGHSHLPLVFFEGDERRNLHTHATVLPLENVRFVANPGSVGQPRDGDPRAAYALIDTGARRVTFRRIEYDVASAQRKIRDAGLPEILAARLALGH